MNTIKLDGRKMNDRKTVHSYLKKQLRIEEYHGNNLDALWDALSTVQQPMRIELIHKQEIVEGLANYGHVLLRVLKEAAEKNVCVEFKEAEC